MCLYINWKAHTACDLNFIVKGEGLLKVTGSHVHCKSGNISETVLVKNVVINRPLTVSDTRIRLKHIAAIVMNLTLSVLEGHSLLQAVSRAIIRDCGATRGRSASSELLVSVATINVFFSVNQMMLTYHWTNSAIIRLQMHESCMASRFTRFWSTTIVA